MQSQRLSCDPQEQRRLPLVPVCVLQNIGQKQPIQFAINLEAILAAR